MSALSPKHYGSHPSGLECIEVTRYQVFTVGNAIKYLWWLGMKDEPIVEVGKSKVYLDWVIEDSPAIEACTGVSRFILWYRAQADPSPADTAIYFILRGKFQRAKEILR